MRFCAWTRYAFLPALLAASVSAVAAQQTPAPRATKRSTKPAPRAAAPAPAEPMPATTAAELEADHAAALARIDEALKLQSEPKKKAESKAAFDSAIKQLQALQAKVDKIARAHLSLATRMENEAATKAPTPSAEPDPEAKRLAIAASTAAREKALQQTLAARQLEVSAKRQKDAIAEMSTAIKDGKPLQIRAASAAFSFELRRVTMILNPPPTPAPSARAATAPVVSTPTAVAPEPTAAAPAAAAPAAR